MTIIDGKIKCGNPWEQMAVDAILCPEIFYYDYLHPKVKKQYRKILSKCYNSNKKPLTFPYKGDII